MATLSQPPGRRTRRCLAAVVCLLLVAVFCSLGVWQVRRLAWKTALIAEVDARLDAAPAPAPGPDHWRGVSRERDQYRRVTVRGAFLHDRETLVQAVTDAGPGYWVITPLVTPGGYTVLVNRGFVPPERSAPGARTPGTTSGEQQVTGLLRITEPHGGFLRANDPRHDRWRSRDVAAIAARRGLSHFAPYFIDADASPNPGGWPRGGLTVVRFANSHLAYALTWFTLALGSAIGLALVLRDDRARGPA